MAFAEPTDVATAYEGSLPAESEARVQYLLDTASARLRILLPDLEAQIVAADAVVEPPATESDLAIMARDVVVQSVLRRLPGSNAQQVRSMTQQGGPFQVTQTYTTDTSGFFSDEDLDLLRGPGQVSSMGALGTIRLGRPDYCW